MSYLKIFAFTGWAVLIVACHTEFKVDDDGGDTTTDPDDDASDVVPPDGMDVPVDETPEVVPDTEADSEPPPVACRLARSHEYPFPTGSGSIDIHAGCWIDGSSGERFCDKPGFWLAMLDGTLVALYAGEELIFGAATRVAGQIINLATLDANEPSTFNSPFGAYTVHLWGASLVQRTEHAGELFLLYTTSQRVTGFNREMNIEIVVIDTDDGASLNHEIRRLFVNPVPESVGFLSHPMGVQSPTTGRYHLFFLIEQEGSEGEPGPTQVWGNYMNPGGLRSGSFTSHTDFETVIGDMTEPYFYAAPDCIDELVALPYLRVGLTLPVLRPSILLVDTSGGGPGYDSPRSIAFNGTRAYTGALAGTWLTADRYAMGALSSASMTMIGADPPFAVNTAVEERMPVVTDIGGTDIEEVIHPFIVEMDYYDFNDAKILHDADRDLHYYVHPFYHFPGGTAHAWIFPLRPDGALAGDPFVFETGQMEPSAFDATLNPDTGRLYVGYFDDTDNIDGHGRIPRYSIHEIICD